MTVVQYHDEGPDSGTARGLEEYVSVREALEFNVNTPGIYPAEELNAGHWRAGFAIVYQPEDKLLLLRRNVAPSYGLWSFPFGREDGSRVGGYDSDLREPPLLIAINEAYEEMDAVPSGMILTNPLVHRTQSPARVSFTFLLAVTDDAYVTFEPDLEGAKDGWEHDAWIWHDIGDLVSAEPLLSSGGPHTTIRSGLSVHAGVVRASRWYAEISSGLTF